MAEKTEPKTEPKTEKTITLPKGLTLEWCEKHLGEKGKDFFHDTARNYGFGDLRNESFAGGNPPALDLNGLTDAQFAALEKKAAE